MYVHKFMRMHVLSDICQYPWLLFCVIWLYIYTAFMLPTFSLPCIPFSSSVGPVFAECQWRCCEIDLIELCWWTTPYILSSIALRVCSSPATCISNPVRQTLFIGFNFDLTLFDIYYQVWECQARYVVSLQQYIEFSRAVYKGRRAALGTSTVQELFYTVFELFAPHLEEFSLTNQVSKLEICSLLVCNGAAELRMYVAILHQP